MIEIVLFTWYPRIFELAHCICICHSFFTIAILEWGNILAIVTLPKSFSFSILLSGAIGTISQVISSAVYTGIQEYSHDSFIQCFFTERIRVVSGGLLAPIACWVLSILRAVLIVVATCEAFSATSLRSYEIQWKWLCVLILALGAAVDFLVAILLCFYLNTMHKLKDNPRYASHRTLPRHLPTCNMTYSTSFIIDKLSIWTIREYLDFTWFPCLLQHT